ncbi:MAG: murein L,D-transpeptidase [Bacillota bacterium]|nr:MAG: murein L,D-transpeptidase [Bacillota bacterium]
MGCPGMSGASPANPSTAMRNVRLPFPAILLLAASLYVLATVRWVPVHRALASLYPPLPPGGGTGLVVVKSANWLFVFEDGRVVRRYDVATGKAPFFTPEGHFTVANKSADPGDPRYGPRWLGLSVPDAADKRGPAGDPRAPAGHKYGIHGTDEPESIGGYHSGGCVRLRNEDVIELYERVEVGMPVEVRR